MSKKLRKIKGEKTANRGSGVQPTQGDWPFTAGGSLWKRTNLAARPCPGKPMPTEKLMKKGLNIFRFNYLFH